MLLYIFFLLNLFNHYVIQFYDRLRSESLRLEIQERLRSEIRERL